MYKLDEISEVLAKIKDKNHIEEFFQSILTESEIDEISSRWELVKLLDDGLSQRKISEELGVSLCKITRGSKELKQIDSAFKRMVHKYKKQKKKGDLNE